MKVFHVWCWKMDIHTSETLLIPKDFWSMFVNFSTSTTTVIFQDHAWKHYFRLLLRNRMIWRILSFESYNESYLKWKRHYMKWKRPLIRYITASRFSNDILQVKTSLIPPENMMFSGGIKEVPNCKISLENLHAVMHLTKVYHYYSLWLHEIFYYYTKPY